MEKQMDVLYPQIAELILGMIPEEKWSEIYLYAEVLDDSSNVYFYFNTPGNIEFIYSHDIPEKYGVSEKVYDDLLLELQSKFEELRKVFIENDQEAWTNLTFTLKYPGKLNIKYNYDDILSSRLTTTKGKLLHTHQKRNR